MKPLSPPPLGGAVGVVGVVVEVVGEVVVVEVVVVDVVGVVVVPSKRGCVFWATVNAAQSTPMSFLSVPMFLYGLEEERA